MNMKHRINVDPDTKKVFGLFSFDADEVLSDPALEPNQYDITSYLQGEGYTGDNSTHEYVNQNWFFSDTEKVSWYYINETLYKFDERVVADMEQLASLTA